MSIRVEIKAFRTVNELLEIQINQDSVYTKDFHDYEHSKIWECLVIDQP